MLVVDHPTQLRKILNANDLQYQPRPATIVAEGQAMYVCVCHGISEKLIGQAIEEGVRSFEQLQSCTGVATCCGACEPCARQLLDQALDSPPSTHQAA
jgi:bacterioferritin-associated ferredoxin